MSPSAIVYSCTFANYDETFGPLARTPNTQFLRFGTTRPNRWRIWQHRPIPPELQKGTQTLTNRHFKLFPAQVLPECDVAIYVDGNILIRRDLSPIIQTFWESGADIALFRHPSARTLEQEIDFALEHKIPPGDVPAVETQRQKYAEQNLLTQPITENTILFYRMSSAKVAELGRLWWDELDRYCKRDQISLPFVLHKIAPKVHLWDWHFHHPSSENLYFARHGHRQANGLQRLRQVTYFMKDYDLTHGLIYRGLKAGGVLRKWIARS